MVFVLSYWALVKPESEKVDATKLINAGIRIYEYVPNYGYISYIPSGLKLKGVKIQDIPVSLKVSKLIYEGKFDDAKDGGLVELLVVGFPDADKTKLELDIRRLGYEPVPFEDVPRFKVLVPEDEVIYFAESIASLPYVVRVEPYYKNYLWNRNTRWSFQTHTFGDSLVWAHGLHGEGEIIGIMDTGLDYYSCFFRDSSVIMPGPTHRKVVNYRQLSSSADDFATCTSSHGTHVSGTAAGDPDTTGIFLDFRGMAYKAKITFGDAGGPSCGSCMSVCYSYSLQTIYGWFYNDGARIISNSWGSNINYYTTGARDADQVMWDRKDVLILFAAGNNSSASSYEDGTVGSPAVAKNILTVGATGTFTTPTPNDEIRAWYSSQGPTYDGRIKPDVMIPGGDDRFNPRWITSARNRTDRTYSCAVVGTYFEGTSMATPAAAGAAAIVRQYYREGWYPTGSPVSSNAFNPQGSLIKATLIASAERLLNENPPPNGAVGWGRINLKRALFFSDMTDKHRLFVVDDSVGVQSGATETYTVPVGCSTPSTSPYFKVVLAWTDAPGTTLQNDLDLEVVAPDGTIYKGNKFDSSGHSIPNPTGPSDYVNNVEVVYVENAPRGFWTVRVIGRSMNNPKPGGQPYSLVAIDGGPCGNNDPLGVSEMPIALKASKGYAFSVKDGTIIFSEEGEVYTVSGRFIGKFKAGDKVKLRKGIYFISVGERMHKVIVR